MQTVTNKVLKHYFFNLNILFKFNNWKIATDIYMQ